MLLMLMIGIASLLGFLEIPLAQPTSDNDRIVDLIPSKGEVDWTNGVIRAMGVGVAPPNAVNARQGREMAKRAARVVAYRNLLEIVQGIRVDSTTLVKNYMVEEDRINSKVQGIIKGARVTDEKEFPDGSVEVRIEMKLNTDLGTTFRPSPTTKPKPIPFIQSRSASDQNIIYTGLVIDAQGMPVQTSLNPRILLDDGQVVYDKGWVDQKISQNNGIVGWEKGIDAAISNDRVTHIPLTVTAMRTEGTDFVIGEADAQTLHLVPDHVQFLKKARVVVVIDQ